MNAESWTIKDIINWSVPYLKKSESPSARLDTELLLAHSLNCKRIDLYLQYDKPLNRDERDRFRSYLKRRALGEPISYILGYREFYGLSFDLTSDVLIPRPETEHLVEFVEGVIKKRQQTEPIRVLDIGTGSGCIAVVLKKLFPEIHVEAWDISEKALDVAKANSESHDVTIDFRLQNALDERAWQRNDLAVDIICSNPPYIGFEEKLALHRSVRDYEPHQALFADQDGLIFYLALAKFAATKLRSEGWLVCEIGSQQGHVVSKIFEDHGWAGVSLYKDLAGMDRVIAAQLSPSSS